MPTLFILGTSFFVIFAIQRYFEVQRKAKSVQFLSGAQTTLLSTRRSIWTITVGLKIPGVSNGIHFNWKQKHRQYAETGWDATADIFLLPSTTIEIALADAEAIKKVATNRARFPKPIEIYKVLALFGDNIVSAEGEEWKRYRKIAAPAFSDRNHKLVWDETLLIMLDLFDNVWGSQESIVTIDDSVSLTVEIGLYVLSAAAFGRRILWKDNDVPPDHQMSFKNAIYNVSSKCITKLALPEWAMGLNEHTRHVNLAFKELNTYMLEMISDRQNSEKVERYDLLGALLEASADDPTFTVRDLTGNIFIFLIAGHETTAHAACFALALLALYPDQQEILFEHIKLILPDGGLPTYEDMSLLTHSWAVLYETLRMFPPVPDIPKYVAEDTTLTIGNASGEQRAVPLPRGTVISVDVPGLHYNPRYWKDPKEFRPARFLDPNWPRDAFIPFSAGARACIGRKFAETTIIAILTMIVSRYKLEIKEESQFSNETFEQRKARVLASKGGFTLTNTPKRVPLVFRRR